MAPKITNCCCCIPLANGVVIISVLWLLYGIYTIVSAVINLSSDVFVTRYISTIILYILITLGAAYGLFVLAFAKTYKLLLIYSRIAYFIAAVDVINSLSAIIVYVSYESSYLDLCMEYNSGDDCYNTYNYALEILIISAVISSIISVYFALVVAAYVEKRKDKENANNNTNTAGAAAVIEQHERHPYGQTYEDMRSVT